MLEVVLVVVAAVIAVVAVSLIKNVDMSKRTKNIIAAVVSAILGVVASLLQAGGIEALTAGGVTGTIVLVYGAAQAFYHFLMEDKSLDRKLEEVGGR